MDIYLINSCFRVDGVTGKPVEEEFAHNFKKHYDEIRLESAKNQYISFQVVFDTRGEGLGKMDINFRDLKGTGAISCSEYAAFIEWFHKINGKFIPDALIPLDMSESGFKVPLDDKYLPEQRVGALWVDLFIPGETGTGEYRGKISIVTEGVCREFTVSVRVYDVVIPDESRIYLDLNAYADNISGAFPQLAENDERFKDGSYFEVEKEFYRLAYDHRCIFHYLPYTHSGFLLHSFAPELEGEGKNIRIKSWELFDRHFGPYLDGTAFQGSKRGERPIKFMYLPFNFTWPSSYEKWGRMGYETEFKRILQEFARHFEEKGWTDTYFELFFNHKKRYRYFPYDGDETRFLEDARIFGIFYDYGKDILNNTGVKFIFRTDSSWAYGRMYKEYSNKINMWVVGRNILSWYPESIPSMKENECIVFAYGQTYGIDKSLLAHFTWPMCAVMCGIDGYTVWNSTGFGDNYFNTPYNNGCEVFWYPGNGLSTLPLLPSIRLKILRNYMQTADMIMQTKGIAVFEKARAVINKHLQLERNDWFAEKPGFLNDPIHTWTNEMYSSGSPVEIYEGRSPCAADRVNAEILKLLDGGAENA